MAASRLKSSLIRNLLANCELSFPYADSAHAYWTGYFVSRVAEKGQVRDTNRYLQGTRTYLSQLKFLNYSQFLNANEQAFFSSLDLLEQAMGVNQVISSTHLARSGSAAGAALLMSR